MEGCQVTRCKKSGNPDLGIVQRLKCKLFGLLKTFFPAMAMYYNKGLLVFFKGNKFTNYLISPWLIIILRRIHPTYKTRDKKCLEFENDSMGLRTKRQV